MHEVDELSALFDDADVEQSEGCTENSANDPNQYRW